MNTYPRSYRRELLCEDGDFGTFQRDQRTICTAGLRKGNRELLLFGLLAFNLLGSMGSTRSPGKGGLQAEVV